MAETQETVADIIAEKRRRADDIERDCAEKMKSGEMISDQYARELVADIRREADRLEAAHNREVAVSKTETTTGDAKLREAALAIRADILKRRSENCWYATDSDILEKIDAALAAPPRNCDLARDWMRDLYAHFQPPASIKREMPPEWVDSVMAFCRWLVAPATVQEGGAK